MPRAPGPAGGQQVPDAVADDPGRARLDVDQRGGGQEQIRVRLGVPDHVPGDHRRVVGQSEHPQRLLRREAPATRRDRPRDPVGGQRAEQLARARQGLDRVDVRQVLSRVILLEQLDVRVGQGPAGLPQQRGHEEPAAHADAPVDAPHGQVDVDLGEGEPPRDDVLVDAVDQRPVEVEQERRARRVVVLGLLCHIRNTSPASGRAFSRAPVPARGPRGHHRYGPVCGAHATWPDRLAGFQTLPGHDDIRIAVRRADVGLDPRPRGRGRHRLPRLLRRVSARRRPQHQGGHRGDPRPLAARQTGPVHRGDEVLRADRAGAVRRRQLAQAHHVRGRRVAAPAADRLHRPVSAARL